MLGDLEPRCRFLDRQQNFTGHRTFLALMTIILFQKHSAMKRSSA
ncbi:hypothetical protein U91I_01021 [alpha proteobacterium U9-1i]|nr:hypothetical protein U91I_01021 [alpha proteobacterium U9-1i]